jgi:hypothetical protein
MAKTAMIPDKDALARVGASVRKRLAADPQAYRVETDKAEIFAFGDFLSPAECQRLVMMIDAVAQPSKLYDTDYSTGFRTSYSGNLDPHDPFVAGVSRRIDDLLGMKPELGEAIQGQRYMPGQLDGDGVPQRRGGGRRHAVRERGGEHHSQGWSAADLEQCPARWQPERGYAPRGDTSGGRDQVRHHQVVSHPQVGVKSAD